MSSALARCQHVAGWASEELEYVQASDAHGEQAPLLVVYDPLDGSSNIEANISIGTIFSILPHRYRGPNRVMPTSCSQGISKWPQAMCCMAPPP
jgi:fructose-1,6-bisphosphatase